VEARLQPVRITTVVVLIIGAAFALGIGVTGLLDDERAPIPLRLDRIPSEIAAIDVLTDNRGSRFELLDEVYQILERDFVEPTQVDLDRFREAAASSILSSLNDTGSSFIDAEAARQAAENQSGTIQGIGVSINSQPDGNIVITRVIAGAPAEAAGILAGDLIVTIDDEPAANLGAEQAAARVRGPSGTSTQLEVIHQDGTFDVLTIVRSEVVFPSIATPAILDRVGNPVTDVAFIRIELFNVGTDADLATLLDAVTAAGIDQLIIDLRGNQGGLLVAATDVADQFLDGGVIVRELRRDEEEHLVEAQPGGAGVGLTLAVLVNENTAGSAEVLAGALRDQGRAIVVGEQTAGQGTLTEPRNLSDGSVLNVSVARWETPNGDLIDGIGIIPDILITLTPEDTQAQRDAQLFAALDFLRGAPLDEES